MAASITFTNGLTIHYTHDLDGGGTDQYPDFLDTILKLGKKYNTCLEWCAGHGAIGFSILDAGICENLYLMDKYEPAYHASKVNIESNNLHTKVKAQFSDSIHKIPKDIKFDLVVANPPHVPVWDFETPYNENGFRICADIDWNAHKEFFKNITQYLLVDGDIFLSEIGIQLAHIEMAEQGGLKYIDRYPAPKLASYGPENACIMHYKYLP